MKVPNYSYLFLFLSILSFNVLAGADPDEVTLEEEMQIENATQKKDYVQKDNIELKIENELLRLSIFNHKYAYDLLKKQKNYYNNAERMAGLVFFMLWVEKFNPLFDFSD